MAGKNAVEAYTTKITISNAISSTEHALKQNVSNTVNLYDISVMEKGNVIRIF